MDEDRQQTTCNSFAPVRFRNPLDCRANRSQFLLPITMRTAVRNGILAVVGKDDMIHHHADVTYVTPRKSAENFAQIGAFLR
jgi:hypothetical protein